MRAPRSSAPPAPPARRPARPCARSLAGWVAAGCLSLVLSLATALSARAELQFDVFVGFDDHVRAGNWFPVAFEIMNDGPSFTGTVVIAHEGEFDTQRRSFTIELPTGTRKRTVLPVFAASGRLSPLDAQLLDPKGTVLADRTGLQPQTLAAHVPILGALPRTFGGLPTLPGPADPTTSAEYAPVVARLQSDYLPANPLALEALSALYLNSEKAADLKPEQVDALIAWIHTGGHLIVGIEQPSDVSALPWLRGLVPFVPNTLTNLPGEGSLDRWLLSGQPALQLRALAPAASRASRAARPARPPQVHVQPPADADPANPFTRLTPDATFNNAELPVLTGRLRDGKILLSLGDVPLIVSAPRGRGTVTALAFSPEREPFRSWNNRAWFWAKVVAVPPELLAPTSSPRWGGLSIDGLFGAMLDSRQVRKLPVTALLLLLVVYLGVIGPFDQWILRRMGRQMWTWITFPTYVVLFSALIYFIGYRLRAGDLEWNELQVVDQLPRSEESAVLRGRTWFSIYSPANARYRLASAQNLATLRSEYRLDAIGRADAARLNQRLPARGFEAEADVPVWVSQLYASDWIEPAAPLLTGRVTVRGTTAQLTLENPSNLRFDALQILLAGRLHPVSALNPGQRLDLEFDLEQGNPLEDLLALLPSAVRSAEQRRTAFGDAASGQLNRDLSNVILASFTEQAPRHEDDHQRAFIAPAAFDLGPVAERGDAVVFAWASEQAIAQPIQRFSPKRSRRDVVVRLVLTVERPS